MASYSPNLRAIVARYKNEIRRRALSKIEMFCGARSLKDAILLAPFGGPASIHAHQKRIGRKRLSAFANKLLANEESIQNCTNFEDLHALITNAKFDGIGELTLYDTALRIGAYLQIEPDNVYLHCGTRVGAKNLGLIIRGRAYLKRDELPKPLRELRPREIEDLLCIYRDNFNYASREAAVKAACAAAKKPKSALK